MPFDTSLALWTTLWFGGRIREQIGAERSFQAEQRTFGAVLLLSAYPGRRARVPLEKGRVCRWDPACAPQATGFAPLPYGQWMAYVPL
ncbi:hypothetical protein CHLRE_05g241629v5 [Chlamydomonas reinhardtii]|uniref:Uncharacterized protein n=1 Tax=Chlamydomonas reinhardtii TaxID=3055 RepID=A0A2K3DSK7_CHLRE|nr:uncharacterized protein CHLRE_05g241629v5 [Chlamydomonas reinhardtii]PNW83488.1 hypothetical protein CHLRE_05g241629v5 [Chlamydomonas reinhardtii]